MPTHLDIPTRSQMEELVRTRQPGCVSLYLPTQPDGQRSDAERLELANLAKEAMAQVGELGLPRGSVPAMEEQFDDLVDDDEFWRFQANALAVFAVPGGIRTFRLPNKLDRLMQVSDRYMIKPILRTFTFPHSAFVLAISQGAVRLIAASPDLPPDRLNVPDLPSDVASAVGKRSVRDKSYDRRVGGSEGKKVRMRQYARQVDQAVRPVLAGQEVPLVLAGSEPMISIFRSVNSYPHLVEEVIGGNPDSTSDDDLVRRLRPVLDGVYRADLDGVRAAFEERRASGRAVSDLADVARAATVGAVETLLVDIDVVVPGEIDDDSGIIRVDEAPDAANYGLADEMARRVLLTGGRVLAVRTEDMPTGTPAAALLRFALA